MPLTGRSAEAIAKAERSLKMRENTLDKTNAACIRYQVARILVQAGAHERARDTLEPLLTQVYSEITPGWLRLEPTFRPLRGNARCERMIGNAK